MGALRVVTPTEIFYGFKGADELDLIISVVMSKSISKEKGLPGGFFLFSVSYLEKSSSKANSAMLLNESKPPHTMQRASVQPLSLRFRLISLAIQEKHTLCS
jgi:hypothetical protein